MHVLNTKNNAKSKWYIWPKKKKNVSFVLARDGGLYTVLAYLRASNPLPAGTLEMLCLTNISWWLHMSGHQAISNHHIDPSAIAAYNSS